MPQRIVSWGVLFSSLAMILLTYTPKEYVSGWSFNQTYYIPQLNIPSISYLIMGGILGVLSLFLVISAFWESWSNRVENFIIEQEHEMLFILCWGSYIMGYFKWIGSLVSNSQPYWVVESAFYAGFILFLIIPIHYYKWLNQRKKARRIPAPATPE